MLKHAILTLAALVAIGGANQARAQSAYMSGEILVVESRAGVNENVEIRPGNSYDISNRIQRIIVTMTNGTQRLYNARDVEQIVFLGSTGHDTCQIVTNNRGETVSDANRDWGRGNMPVIMIGNDGNDTLRSGSETDDYIDGRNGDDVINPGPSGNDTVIGGNGADDFELYYRWTNVFPYRQYTVFPDDYDYWEGDRIYGTYLFVRWSPY